MRGAKFHPIRGLPKTRTVPRETTAAIFVLRKGGNAQESLTLGPSSRVSSAVNFKETSKAPNAPIQKKQHEYPKKRCSMD